ncbi:esterase E4-like [Uranotaenia lowii]|uniref:esterase E4-like n=1 Tax=Uranotaenia lowii TaxID=190385 RepID=UPI00247A1362|nr:esterase E4-like [Uranotaenia lowii]
MWEFIKAVFVATFTYFKFEISCRLTRKFPPAVRPILEIRQGRIRGVTSTLPDGRPYHYFRGIPYAKAPIRELRFRAPVPIERFYQPLVDCTVDRSACIQPFPGGFLSGKENGLYLNVYTSELPMENESNSKLQPVMIWIHGGGFISGSGNSFIYDPVYLVQDGVVVVTMNYRLGALGFLSLPSAGIAGNAGLKDQLLVFRWVQENITKFGGDPNNVTVFGESAGSMAAYLHYLSPNSRKYFNRVICQSGVACYESFFQKDPSIKARKLAQCLGYTGQDDAKVLETLQNAPAALLIKHSNDTLDDQEKDLAFTLPFRPVVEDQLTDDSIITDFPENILKQYDTIRMPLINGCTDGEGLLALRMLMSRLRVLDQDSTRLVPQLMGSPPGMDKAALGEEIRRFYFDQKPIDKKALKQITDLMSDNTFITNTIIAAEWLAKNQPNAKHYHYRFTYDGRFSFSKKIFNLSHVPGASHGDDIFYMFRSALLPSLDKKSEEAQVRAIMVRLWTNFAKYGNPTPGTEDDPILCCQWNPVTPVDKNSEHFDLDCLEINVRPKMIRNPNHSRMQLWRGFLKKYRKNYL